MIHYGQNSVASYSLAITFGTISYHLWMRIGVGFAFNKTMNNKANLSKRWCLCRTWEKSFYEKLRVKRWRKALPTYQPELFDYRKYGWDKVAQSICQAELVHEAIMLLSFAPVVFSIWFGALSAFFITSVIAATIDALFVIAQRYNRSRIIKLLNTKW